MYLQEQLPLKPYCTDDLKTGLHVRPRGSALEKRYIQLNPPNQRVFITFDIDRCTSPYEAYDCDLPQPLWYVLNPQNGHGHLIYGLITPVYTTRAARLRPLQWLAAIEAGMRRKLGSDPMYGGLISKNPWCKTGWIVYNTSKMLYDLSYLSEWVELIHPPSKSPREEVAGLGRNCEIFENVRVWAYREVRGYWSACDGRYGEWFDAVKTRCQEENKKFRAPLCDAEVCGIAKSISRWVWRRMSPGGFSDWQRVRANSRWESKKEEGIGLLKSGKTTREVSMIVGVSQRTSQRWQAEVIVNQEV